MEKEQQHQHQQFNRSNTICVFDVDGTLTPARQEIKPEMKKTLEELQKVVTVGVVGGSDLVKIREQLTDEIFMKLDYAFAENGCIAFKAGKEIDTGRSITNFLGEEKAKELRAWLEDYCKNASTPSKASVFVEWRAGMVNASPIGRSCTQAQRDEFYAWDKESKLREKMVQALQVKFGSWGLQFSIGGQISIDIFPKGWDKTLCLEYLQQFPNIHFFGDRTQPGGNDHEIFASSRTIGHSVTGPENTATQLHESFLKQQQ